ncbi:MAG: hypothetical protein ACRDPF_39930, partial [Streptosporangiaceae bacterium]
MGPGRVGEDQQPGPRQHGHDRERRGQRNPRGPAVGRTRYLARADPSSIRSIQAPPQHQRVQHGQRRHQHHRTRSHRNDGRDQGRPPRRGLGDGQARQHQR